ncbi:MAG: TlpA family protein disulfide reductase [Gammaproteobacteria bacterium]|nr:TlpA family protein disulfide reductase [Gammaproteobacteria bacterium]
MYMKRVLVALGLILVPFIFNGCQSQTFYKFSITHFRLTNESVQMTSGDPIEPMTSIRVHYEVTDENDAVSNVILADGPLIDGELKFTQRVTEPTEVVISVNNGDGHVVFWTPIKGIVRYWTTAVLKPDSEIEFVVTRRATSSGNYYTVFLNAKDHRSLHESQQFSLKGDLSQLRDFNARHARVLLYAVPSVVDGSGDRMQYGPVIVDENEFSIEGDLEKPTLFTLHIGYGSTSFNKSERFHAILEPGISYRVVPWGNQGKFAVVADRDSLHTQLVSNWQFEPETVALINSWVDRRLDSRLGMERENKEEHEKEQIRNYKVAEQCDHVSLTDAVMSKFTEPYRYSYEKIGDLIVNGWSEKLRQILRDTQDPELARMIFELSWMQLEADEIIKTAASDERIAILEELALIMDETFVDEFITPKIKALLAEDRKEIKLSSLRPGQVAPEFTLKSIAGDEVSLSEVLSENELVLVVFWASWCGWCGHSFPEMMRLHSDHKDEGFEIVSISIDDSFERWKFISDAWEFPWIDLGDGEDQKMKGRSSLTADAYDVHLTQRYMPFTGLRGGEDPYYYSGNRFLMDQDGCILNSRFLDFELSEMLTSRSEDVR